MSREMEAHVFYTLQRIEHKLDVLITRANLQPHELEALTAKLKNSSGALEKAIEEQLSKPQT